MQISKEISLGSIVSWALIAAGFIVSYTRLQGDVFIANESAKHAIERAERAEAQAQEVRVLIAEIRGRVISIDGKVDDLNKRIPKR